MFAMIFCKTERSEFYLDLTTSVNENEGKWEISQNFGHKNLVF